MAEVFSVPARERLTKKQQQVHARIMGKYEKMEVSTMDQFDMSAAIGLIFKEDTNLLKLLDDRVVEGFEVINIQEEPKQEVKIAEIEPEKEAAMKQRLLEEAKKVATEVVQEEEQEDLEDFLDDLI